MLEICQNAAGSTNSRRIVVVMTEHHVLRRPILMQFLLLFSSLPSTVGMKDRHRHNGPSRVSVPKHLNSWNICTGTTSLIFMTNLQYRPSWLRRSVTLFVTPHLVRLPHLPSAAALRYHLWTVTRTTDHHKLCRWSLLHFFAQKPPHSYFDKFPTNKEKLILKLAQKCFWTH